MPIACSNRSSLPETLQDAGVYFDPQNDASIAEAIQLLIDDPSLRKTVAARAKQLSEPYSWETCASHTWNYISHTFQRLQQDI